MDDIIARLNSERAQLDDYDEMLVSAVSTIERLRAKLDAASDWARTQWEFLRDLGDHDPLLSQMIYQRTEAARRRYERVMKL